jgi:hypothetical protein
VGSWELGWAGMLRAWLGCWGISPLVSSFGTDMLVSFQQKVNLFIKKTIGYPFDFAR